MVRFLANAALASTGTGETAKCGPGMGCKSAPLDALMEHGNLIDDPRNGPTPDVHTVAVVVVPLVVSLHDGARAAIG